MLKMSKVILYSVCIAVVVACFGFMFSMGAETSATTPLTAEEKISSPCPICGKSTKDTQLAWQGMCEKCYKDYKYTQELYDAI